VKSGVSKVNWITENEDPIYLTTRNPGIRLQRFLGRNETCRTLHVSLGANAHKEPLLNKYRQLADRRVALAMAFAMGSKDGMSAPIKSQNLQMDFRVPQIQNRF
jgi:hypothetical protein